MSKTSPRPPAYRCSLCGHQFVEGDRSHCTACVMPGNACHLVRCPRCGHEFPAGSRLLRWLGSLLGISR
jgi:hypothetical protein